MQSFSKARIHGLESLIHEKLTLFLERLQEAATQKKSIDLDVALNCLTADVTMHYCYQISMGLLDTPDLRPRLILDVHDMGPIIPFFWCPYCPLTNALPAQAISSERGVLTWCADS